MSVSLPDSEISEVLVDSAFRCKFQQFSAEVDRCHAAIRRDALRQGDSRFTGAASQIQHLHSRERPSVFDQRLGDTATHHGRLRFPLLRRYQPVRRTP